MKYLPRTATTVVSAAALTAALAACAAPNIPAGAQSVGTSQQPPYAVAQCIAHKWSDRSQQQVVSQTSLANNQAVDVYVPGQQPPNGAAAIVRPAWTNTAKTWVGFRSGGGAAGDAAGDISGCL